MQTSSVQSVPDISSGHIGSAPPLAHAERKRGLSSRQVEESRARFGRNIVDSKVRRTWWQTLGEGLREPMFLLLLGATGIYFLLGDVSEALALLAFVAAIVFLTVFQSHRTARVLDSLRELSAPRAQVLRDGQRQLVAAAELVPGDLVFVREGARVPADGSVTEAHELSVDESLLTGESVSVSKSVARADARAEEDPGGQLIFGSMVVQGQGQMIVTATGANTKLGRIGKSLTGITEARSPLQLETRTFVNRFTLAAIILCLLLVVAYRLRSGEWLPGVLAGITLAMGILPEEIPVILTVFMALGARRIASEGVLTRRMSAIETLGQTSVLCVDKTGTLTQNRMSVRVLSAQGKRQVIDPTTQRIDEAYHELIEYLVLASEIEPIDPMERAFHETGRVELAGTGRLHDDWSLVHEYALTPELPAMSHAWHAPELDHHAVACKGAPEAVCALCRLDERDTQTVLDEAAQMASGGLRVLGVAKARHSHSGWPEKQHDFEFSFVGLAGLLDPVRPEAAGAIAACQAAGIRVVMITGDYPSTARAIATEVGIDGTRIVTGQEVAAMNDARLREAITNVDVFARVKPEQKLRLVNAFRESDQVVAMTGDGVNDAPALKAAHIGIAMGLRGAEVAREVASLVLLRDDFAPIVSAIRLGRHIYVNLLQAISYTVAVHIPMIAAAMIPVFVGWPPLLAPVHIVFLELIINPVCSIVFENEPERENLMHMPPRRAGARLLSNSTLGKAAMAGALAAMLMLGLYAALLSLSYDLTFSRTVSFMALVACNVALIFVIRLLPQPRAYARARQRNRYLWVVLGVVGTGLLLLMTVPALARLFGLVALLSA
ncbi:cation-translocating P-type ATPase [Paraburkholderia phytofirmans]|uniref:P-type Cu(+) transporter n=1 Tax=Paraburkholderia phytofirmans (strain DSM 17436 / LMG 22146 / PsJN) TaxID=398527 RepID=B2TG88_PARPJ|nr:cation-translocating P-type ATPase [Paraburkholderia phytofirmans]ACD19962.1 ATPase, P-type (transporting), HAD superfamily, subfamily IC [Paraburkholderia phytofirmans PsJN]